MPGKVNDCSDKVNDCPGKVNDCPGRVNVSAAAIRQLQSPEKRKKPVLEHMSRTGSHYGCRLKPIENQRFLNKNNRTPVSIKPDVLLWWGMVDSNHRRHRQQIYSLSPLATREIPHIRFGVPGKAGAGRRTRTPDLLITNQLLYQLSYTSTTPAQI